MASVPISEIRGERDLSEINLGVMKLAILCEQHRIKPTCLRSVEKAPHTLLDPSMLTASSQAFHSRGKYMVQDQAG